MKTFFVILLLVVECFGGEANKMEIVKISFAKKPSGDYECTIVGDGIVLADPSRSYFDLVHVNAKGEKKYLPIRNKRTRLHWKFLIILLKNREDSPSLNTYKFDILREDIVNANYLDLNEFKPIGLRLFWCDYELFEKSGLSAMKLLEMNPRAN